MGRSVESLKLRNKALLFSYIPCTHCWNRKRFIKKGSMINCRISVSHILHGIYFFLFIYRMYVYIYIYKILRNNGQSEKKEEYNPLFEMNQQTLLCVIAWMTDCKTMDQPTRRVAFYQ